MINLHNATITQIIPPVMIVIHNHFDKVIISFLSIYAPPSIIESATNANNKKESSLGLISVYYEFVSLVCLTFFYATYISQSIHK